MPSSTESEIIEAPPTKEGFGLEDLLKLTDENKDPREKAYVELVHNLFDIDKLLMIARLKRYDHISVLRNFIIADFFVDYYNRCSVKFTFKPIDSPPFYIRETKYKYPKDRKDIDDKYNDFIKKIMMITISEDGLGRAEILDALKPMNEELSLKDKIKQRLPM